MALLASTWSRTTAFCSLTTLFAAAFLSGTASAEDPDVPLVGTVCRPGEGPGALWLASWIDHVTNNNPDQPISPGGVDDDLVAVNECDWYYNF